MKTVSLINLFFFSSNPPQFSFFNPTIILRLVELYANRIKLHYIDIFTSIDAFVLNLNYLSMNEQIFNWKLKTYRLSSDET